MRLEESPESAAWRAERERKRATAREAVEKLRAERAERTRAAREAKALAEIEDALRFAMRPRTLQEIGGRLGLSRERVRQIEERALRKLRVRAAYMDEEDVAEIAAVFDKGAR